jgi:hypothetical protein
MGITDAAKVLVFPIWQLLHWLLFGCKNSQQGRAQSVCEGARYRPHPPVPGTGHMGCRPVALATSVKPIHSRGNLACCPDFKVSHCLSGDFVVAPAPDALPSLIVRRGDATRAPLRRSFRVTVIISAVPSGGELSE